VAHTHLPLGSRKGFALRILLREVERMCADQIEGWDTERWEWREKDAWKKFVTLIELTAAAQLPPDDREQNAKRLDELIRDTIVTYAPSDDGTTPYLGPALREALTMVKRFDCDTCLQKASKPGFVACCGRVKNDSEVVALGGNCIYPIRDAAREAIILAQELYGRATGLSQLEANLVTQAGRPEKLRGEFIATTGRLRWADREDVRAVIVEVTVNVDEFDARGLNLLPHCLAHEFICHAFQEAAGDQPRSGGPDGYDPLAEGWMDFLVTGLFERDIRGSTYNQVVETSGLIHKLRRDTTKSEHVRSFPQAGLVDVGAKAAEAVLRVFEHQGKPDGALQDAWADFVDLSCQLNAYPWAATERGPVLFSVPRRLGQQAYRTGIFPGMQGVADVDKELTDALCRWRTSRSSQPWKDAIANVISALKKKT
jgi:hypothetical protein